MISKNKNPWTPEDEKEHFPSVMEWWCAIAFFKSFEDQKQWSLKGSFTEWCKKPKKTGCNHSITLFNLDDDSHVSYYSRNDSAKLKTSNNGLKVMYNDSFLKGSFPNYEMRFRDPKNDITIDLKYSSESLPHWIAQEVTNGYLPMGLGFYRYGFIPKNRVTGTMKTKNETYRIEGQGYYEHVWGDFSYTNPLANIFGLKKTVSTYSKLIKWWIHNHKPYIPKSIMFTTENNPLGYDWVWALLDNGWCLFYGNILFWMMKGPIAGSLILTKDGKQYTEFCNVTFKYNKTEQAKKYDFFYPTELEATAIKGKEKIHLCFKTSSQSREFVSKISDKKYWLAFAICEAPGTVEGYYYDGENKIKLTGICKIEPQRQISVIGHNSLKLDFLLPPKGVGVDIDFDSHFLKKKINTKIHFAPRPHLGFKVKKN